jgi:hypothetical protein
VMALWKPAMDALPALKILRKKIYSNGNIIFRCRIWRIYNQADLH